MYHIIVTGDCDETGAWIVVDNIQGIMLFKVDFPPSALNS